MRLEPYADNFQSRLQEPMLVNRLSSGVFTVIGREMSVKEKEIEDYREIGFPWFLSDWKWERGKPVKLGRMEYHSKQEFAPVFKLGGETRNQFLKIVIVGVRHLAPYWTVYRTRAKGRWFGRKLVDVFSQEFLSTNVNYAVSDLPISIRRTEGHL